MTSPLSLTAALVRNVSILVVIIATLGCVNESREPRPNLLLITVDTLRADSLACYGGATDVGQTLCSIADRGVRYVWAISPAPSTAPAVASILTSQYPASHRVSQFASSTLAFSVQTLAETLSAAGFATAAVVANPVLAPSRQLQQGFSSYDARMNRRELNRVGALERDAGNTTDAALEWLTEAPSPWFLWVHYQDPHGPYDSPDAKDVPDEIGARLLPVLADHSGRNGIPAYQALPQTFAIESYVERYRQEIRYLDGQVSRLLESVRSGGRPTGILLTADHGEAFGEDGYWFAHGHSVGIDQVRVPLLWSPPDPSDSIGASIATIPVSTIDIAPTLLAAAGIQPPESFQGIVLPTDSSEPGDDSPSRILYTEHRLRAGAVAGRFYYRRDRVEGRDSVSDRITGGRLDPMPPRTDRFEADGTLADRESIEHSEIAASLAPLLSSYIEASERRREPVRSVLDEGLRQQLESLGYLE